MTEPVPSWLTSTGWTDWAGVLEVLGDDECLWVDLGGPHHGPAPAQPPVGATHLWSWRPDRWTRVRLDGERALATVLTTGTSTQGEAVTALVTDGLPWGRGRNLRAAEWDRRVRLVVTEGTAPITFVEVPPAAGGPL